LALFKSYFPGAERVWVADVVRVCLCPAGGCVCAHAGDGKAPHCDGGGPGKRQRV
jgi:hypothetical protein